METRIMEILTNVAPEIDFENEKKLIDNEVLDSFTVIQIVTELMEEFGIEIDADDIEPENLNSFEDICQMVKSKM